LLSAIARDVLARLYPESADATTPRPVTSSAVA
jgi:hypothetical protein